MHAPFGETKFGKILHNMAIVNLEAYSSCREAVKFYVSAAK
jgi:hypothetical protein